MPAPDGYLRAILSDKRYHAVNITPGFPGSIVKVAFKVTDPVVTGQQGRNLSPDINKANLIKIHSTRYQQQDCQSTLISPELLFDQSLMNFSMENTTSEILQALAQELMAAFAVGAGFM